MGAEKALEAWHHVVRSMSAEALDEILAEEVVFHSPIVHTPQVGKPITKLYLMAAYQVLPGEAGSAESGGSAPDAGGGAFRYVREVVTGNDAVLEFETSIGGIYVNGVDMIRFDEAGKIVDFKVMIRPLKAIQTVHARMGRMLEALKGGRAAGD